MSRWKSFFSDSDNISALIGAITAMFYLGYCEYSGSEYLASGKPLTWIFIFVMGLCMCEFLVSNAVTNIKIVLGKKEPNNLRQIFRISSLVGYRVSYGVIILWCCAIICMAGLGKNNLVSVAFNTFGVLFFLSTILWGISAVDRFWKSKPSKN